MRIFLPILLLAGLWPGFRAHASEPVDPGTPGIQIYRAQCAICHEKLGSETGLIEKIRAQFSASEDSANNLHQYLNDKIARSGHSNITTAFLPQWMHTLTLKDRQSLVLALERVVKSGTDELDVPASSMPPGQFNELGIVSFRLRCSNCHGITGHGDGHMARFISNPPPANLSRSNKSIDYMRNIIKYGGASVNLSDQMPGWKDELYDEEIEAVAHYVFKLREKSSVQKTEVAAPVVIADALYIISNAALDANLITRNQARNIWLGRTNVLENGERVNPVNQDDNSATHNTFYRAITGKTPSQVKTHWIKLVFSGRQTPPMTLKGNRAVIEWVAQTPNALGYVSTLSYNKAIKILMTVKQ